ncbi:peptidoglycan DD-metalloendopeptidase family protein [Marinicella sediminis]|uniref:Peptidoglycan DD-metalloendopeptidase family protein n=1 Tax=Marinicella sediminis TaxID=1792834 RepID=A0ABV7J711_9GAMM|nr:peptidoglycan DD-metalloendopeptidase family protein [Marinicella sediminis]
MKLLLIISLLVGLTACAPRRPAQVDEVNPKPQRSHTRLNSRHTERKNKTTQQYKVKKGDSLYSIGFRYQVDYKKLAALNDIKPPYRIYPGQIIRLKGSIPAATPKQPAKTQPLTSGPKVSSGKEKTQPQVTQAPATNRPKTSTTAKSSQPEKPKPEVKPAVKPTRKPVVTATPNNSNLKWLWPTDGKIRSTFLASNPARKGISIGGREGQPVKAAEAGVVVYSGNGLLGYGELVIIKHNDQYLSAYGHNKALKVKEGEMVKRGQVIAELGSSGTNVNNLHFEIRKNGKPVNPLDYVKP